jgi:hypothetical protein
MNWKFWQKASHREKSSNTGEVKFAKPRELPDQVGMYLVTKLKLDPDWVWNLKCVMHPKVDEKNVFDIRIFNPITAADKGVVVSNYHSLDQHPGRILFFGSFNKRTGSVELEEILEKVA